MTEQIFYTLEQVARILSISKPKLYRIMGEGKLDWCMVGDTRRITAEQLADYSKRSTRSAEKDSDR
jgi:excisionase family DNA binding protein